MRKLTSEGKAMEMWIGRPVWLRLSYEYDSVMEMRFALSPTGGGKCGFLCALVE